MQLKIEVKLFPDDEAHGNEVSLYYTVVIPGRVEDEEDRTRMVESINGVVDFDRAVNDLCDIIVERDKLRDIQEDSKEPDNASEAAKEPAQ